MSIPINYSILGLDPGLSCTGYSLIRISDTAYKLVDSGTFRTSTRLPLAERLKVICERLQKILDEFRPEEAALEETFMAKNVRSALLLGHIRGALLVTIALKGIPAFEYSPREVKMAVVGYGAASKIQVRSMLQHIFHSKLEGCSLDATDAMAVAICHCNTTSIRHRTNKV